MLEIIYKCESAGLFTAEWTYGYKIYAVWMQGSFYEFNKYSLYLKWNKSL